jgi:NCS1 family nucleobase:cation symporter-1
MIVDYYLVRRGNISIPDLYTFSPLARYHFFRGFNLRGFAAFVIGFTLPLPGFIGSFGVGGLAPAAKNMYDLGWVLSFLTGGLSFWAASVFFKVPGHEEENGLAFERLVQEAEQLVADGGIGEMIEVADGHFVPAPRAVRTSGDTDAGAMEKDKGLV